MLNYFIYLLRDKFEVELQKKKAMQVVAEEWLEEKRRKNALKQKAKRSKE